MTERERDTATDYGYDMAHQDIAHQDIAHGDMAREDMVGEDMAGGRADRAPGPHHSEQPHGTGHQRYTTVHPGRTSDPGADYGYDEAHAF
ncbi:hypothetical protein [Blastococcus mobilis]|uniref:Uncharacterized protein n=1 Tax=Blastococcus mobilis TaxID=1938746 RepID=A0A238WYS2_9ACTN|nr:hypothetical protein [Blastococcus mobilis]SNR51568.1 hypothetical protein SAMN06272737_110140 [Blastococcus mobilis]